MSEWEEFFKTAGQYSLAGPAIAASESAKMQGQDQNAPAPATAPAESTKMQGANQNGRQNGQIQSDRSTRQKVADSLRQAGSKLDKLDTVLAQSFTPPQDAALLAEMLSLPNDGRYPAPELTPEQRRQKTLEALTAQLEALSRQKPVLMIFEDAHRVDPTSLEAFGRLVDRIKTLGVLLIVTYRPEFEPPWVGRPHVTALILNRLDEGQIAAIIDSLTGNKLLSPSVRKDIIERTDGIPLFVEEMTKAVLEAESEDDARQTAAAVPSPGLAVPAACTPHAKVTVRAGKNGIPQMPLPTYNFKWIGPTRYGCYKP
jgi:hypothetical protein